MTTPEDMAFPSRKELLALVAELQRRVAVLQKQVAELSTRNQALAAENDQLQRSARPPLSPKGPVPGSLGAPAASLVKAPSPFARLAARRYHRTPSSCGGPSGVLPRLRQRMTEERVDLVYVTELPPLPHPRVTQYRVWVCRCLGCGQRVRGQHPDLAPDQYGAIAHRVGQRVMAAAHTLHYQIGIPVRKVPAVLETLTGLQLTQGAITQDALRRARGQVGTLYQGLRAKVRDAPGEGQNAQLMAFDTDEVTVYQVRPRHRHQEVQEVVPASYQGVMITDRGRSYEAHSFRKVRQQKCLAHLQKTLSLLLEQKKGRARQFEENLKMLLRMAMDLWEEYHAGETKDFESRAAELRLVISYQLKERGLRDRDNRHLLKVLRRYHQRGELLRFLEEPLVEPTNNRVERALRPAVIARKVSSALGTRRETTLSLPSRA